MPYVGYRPLPQTRFFTTQRHCQIWLFVPLLLILLNKHILDSQRGDRVCRHGHGHVTWHIGHIPDPFAVGALQSTSIFHYLHRHVRTPWFRKQLRTFTCKSIKIIAPILLVCIELNPGPPKCYLCRKSIKTNDKKLIFNVTTAPTRSIVTVVTLMTANTGN